MVIFFAGLAALCRRQIANVYFYLFNFHGIWKLLISRPLNFSAILFLSIARMYCYLLLIWTRLKSKTDINSVVHVAETVRVPVCHPNIKTFFSGSYSMLQTLELQIYSFVIYLVSLRKNMVRISNVTWRSRPIIIWWWP